MALVSICRDPTFMLPGEKAVWQDITESGDKTYLGRPLLKRWHSGLVCMSGLVLQAPSPFQTLTERARRAEKCHGADPKHLGR